MRSVRLVLRVFFMSPLPMIGVRGGSNSSMLVVDAAGLRIVSSFGRSSGGGVLVMARLPPPPRCWASGRRLAVPPPPR